MKLRTKILLAAMLMATPTLTCVAQDAMAISSEQSAPVATTLTLTREQCIEIALQDNPTIKVADMELKRVDYSKREVIASLFPAIDFSVAYQRAIELQTINMDMGAGPMEIKMGSDNTWNMGFTATLPIVSAQLWKSIQMSDTQILASVESARASRLDLIDQVNRAYYGLLLSQASYEVLKQNYDNAKVNADLIQKKFDVGTASEYDVLRSSVQVKNVEPELLQAEIGIKQAKLLLKILMGMDASTDFEAAVSLESMEQDMYGYVMGVESDLSQNTNLRTLDIQTKQLKQNVAMKKLAWVPTIGAQFNWSWTSLSNGHVFNNIHLNPYSNVAVSVAVPIFSGGSKYYGLKQAQVQLNEMALQRENLVRSLNMQVELALDNINKEIKQISTSAEGVRQAQKAHQIMQKSFEIGAATYLDLRDSELANTAAQLNYYQAIYNYLCSTSQLDLLLGKEDTLNIYKKATTDK
ncbi:MAG: TolC family protein [Muribaculaceae bacterium]|nr:TolC family protein [Muribaculaceae bacterium]